MKELVSPVTKCFLGSGAVRTIPTRRNRIAMLQRGLDVG